MQKDCKNKHKIVSVQEKKKKKTKEYDQSNKK